MNKKRKIEIAWIEETAIQSIISDTFSLGAIAVFFWFNFNFIGNSYFVNFIILLIIIIKVFANSKGKKRKTIAESRKFLDELENKRRR